jgi:hypothetical protein
MRRKTIFVVISVLVLTLGGAFFSIRWFLHQLLVGHQQSTTREIAAWGEEHSKIRNPNEAARAAEMVEYIRNYYVVSEGYSSDTEADAALEEQRRKTIEQINTALRKYKESGESSD